MKVAQFDPAGGPVVATITSGHAQPGSYRLLLWEAHANKVVMRGRGNFLNTDDDAFKLPLPNIGNHERLAECLATVVITPPIKDYALRLSISQGGTEIGFDELAGKATTPTVTADLFVRLEAT
ncbi:MAG: hypothetical protein ACREL3_04595 [Gemmatimonadales bacterium]